jgi:glycosyl transferase family 87
LSATLGDEETTEMPSGRVSLIVLAAVCAFFGVIGWAFYTVVFSQEPAQDWMVFYTAARAYYEGNLPLVFDGERFTAVLNERFADWLSVPLNLHPWINPPHFLLFVLPFALLPFGASYAAFLALTFAGLAVAIWRLVPSRQAGFLFLASLALCPATPFTIFTGQSTFLTASLLIAGAALLERRPVLAGIILGTLAYKPQFCLMLPFALLAGGHWRTIIAAGATAALLMLVSAALFGLDIWRFWIEFATGSSELYQAWIPVGRLKGQSVYTCAILLGASSGVANAAQAAAMILAAAAVFWSFRSAMRRELRLAVLLAATVLAAPHVSTSDALLMGIAATLFLAATVKDGFRPVDLLMAGCLWTSPLLSPPSLFIAGTAIPLLLCLFLLWVTARAHRDRLLARATTLRLAPR